MGRESKVRITASVVISSITTWTVSLPAQRAEGSSNGPLNTGVPSSASMAFPNTHFLAYADDMGMSVLHAANAISVTAIFSVIGSVLLGMAADRYDRSYVLALTYALRGLAFLLLILLPGGNLIYLYGLVLGISWTATTPLTAAIAADRYGPRQQCLLCGSLFPYMNLGFGVGSFVEGVAHRCNGGADARSRSGQRTDVESDRDGRVGEDRRVEWPHGPPTVAGYAVATTHS